MQQWRKWMQSVFSLNLESSGGARQETSIEISDIFSYSDQCCGKKKKGNRTEWMGVGRWGVRSNRKIRESIFEKMRFLHRYVCLYTKCVETQSTSLKSFFIALTTGSNDLFICVCLLNYCIFVHCLLSPWSLRTEVRSILFKVTYSVFSLVPGTQ